MIGGESGRGSRIRTYDLVVPNDALYQAELYAEKAAYSIEAVAAWEGGIRCFATPSRCC